MKILKYKINRYIRSKNKSFKISITLILFIFILKIYSINISNHTSTHLKYLFKFRSILSRDFDSDFLYQNYQRYIITEKIKKYSKIEQSENEYYFLNGIIRKFKPQKCLEIGVSSGGSSVIILNAIKDNNNSFLISLDLNENLYLNKSLKTGYIVKTYFPELYKNKWQLYTGKQPHIFLSKLKLKYDFLFLDTVHKSPGEIINIIEALPFLEDNAIIVLHDILFHITFKKYYQSKSINHHPSNIILFTSLMGNKIILPNEKIGLENIGAIILYPEQERFYLNYFVLLLAPWEYLPNKIHIEELRIFIKEYYKKDLYLRLFDKSVQENRKYILKY